MKSVIKAMIVLALAAVVSSTTGCATTRQMVKMPDQSQRIQNAEMARIYLVRPTAVGGAIAMEVQDGATTIGTTGGKGFLCWERAPGPTSLSSKAENTDTLPLTLEKNNVYYVRQGIRVGWMMARCKLILLTEDEGKEDLKSCKPPVVSN